MSLLKLLGLDIGNWNVSLDLGSRLDSLSNSVLHQRAPTYLLPRKEDAVGLHKSVVVARQIVEESKQVPTSELEDILEKLRDLENQVEGLLGDDDEDAVEVTTTTENAQNSDGGMSEEESAPNADNSSGGEAPEEAQDG